MGGFFFDFEAVRTESRDRDAPRRSLSPSHVLLRVAAPKKPARSIAVSRRGPNGLNIEKETTHFHHSWRRRASMA